MFTSLRPMTSRTLNIGDTVRIKGPWNHDNIFAGEWGVVRLIKGGQYHVGIAGGDPAPVFGRRELLKDKVNYITKLPQ